MNNDLISREALKEVINYNQMYVNPKLAVDDVIKLIDSAQPVPLPDFKAGYKQAILDGKTNFSRPQGEWIDTGSGQECNVCHEIQYGYDNFRHFCANCGADMRKGDKE